MNGIGRTRPWQRTKSRKLKRRPGAHVRKASRIEGNTRNNCVLALSDPQNSSGLSMHMQRERPNVCRQS
jgi:hypothetical protein